MTTFAAPPIDPATATRFTDQELEEELTLASLTSARAATFDVLLAERRRRRLLPKNEPSSVSLFRRLADSLASRDGSAD